jgi:hypothetical protein
MRPFPILAILLNTAIASAGNALVNGDFELGLSGWSNDGAAASTVEHAQGERACMVRLPVAGWSGVHQSVVIPSGSAQVKVSGWMRADSVRGGKENWERGRISIGFHDAKGDTLGGYPPAVGQVRGRLSWTRMERVYALPSGAATVRIECALGNSSGTLYCDDLSVEFLP